MQEDEIRMSCLSINILLFRIYHLESDEHKPVYQNQIECKFHIRHRSEGRETSGNLGRLEELEEVLKINPEDSRISDNETDALES